MYKQFGKRLLDVLLASLLLFATAPILLACAFAIRLDSSGPIFFRHVRVGRHGRGFHVLKLRTMHHAPGGNGKNITVQNDARVTRVGRFLRLTKLDEVPQLVNVFRGQMSFVGPRPEVPEYVAAYPEEYAKLLELRPGITSAASLAFIEEEQFLRNRDEAESFYVSVLLPRKLAIESEYPLSLSTDLQLIAMTLMRIGSRVRSRKSQPICPIEKEEV